MSLPSLVRFWARRFQLRQRKQRPITRQWLMVEELEQRTVLSTVNLSNHVIQGATLQVKTDPNTDRFITGLYYDVLHRQPTRLEVTDWVTRLNSFGVSKQQVATDFANGTEFLAKQIANDYQKFLG